MAIVCVALTISVAVAQKKAAVKFDYVNASELTLVGKLCQTTNPYHRMEVDQVNGISKGEARLLKQASGLAIAFKTDAKAISVKAEFGPSSSWGPYAPLVTTTGFSLFIKDDNGEWTWAAAKAHRIAPTKDALGKLSAPLTMINGLAEGEKECLLYLPL